MKNFISVNKIKNKFIRNAITPNSTNLYFNNLFNIITPIFKNNKYNNKTIIQNTNENLNFNISKYNNYSYINNDINICLNKNNNIIKLLNNNDLVSKTNKKGNRKIKKLNEISNDNK